ncbi:MAG: NAD(P)H-binding protein [Opitutaceae bacterium]|nr:NAD(P)H-binding protein [Opitutaceae bacterium]
MGTPTREALVTGAAGFIGRRVVSELSRRGWRVRAFIHHADAPDFSACEGVVMLVGDVRDPAAVSAALAGTDAAISLAACKMDEPESEATNVGGARHLVDAARAAGVTRIINVSTQSAKLPRPGVYGRTKRAADEAFAASGLVVTTLRPSLVYGADDPGVFGTVQRFVDRLPVVPVCGDGRWLSAPVHVEDVARVIVDCLETPSTVGNTYDIAGPDLLPFDALIDQIAAHLGRRRPTFHLPLALALPAVRILRTLWPRAPISVSNVLGSTQDTAIDPAPALRDLAFAPRPLARGLHEVFGSASDRAWHAEARALAHHLLHVEPSPELRDRYIEAARHLFGETPGPATDFVRRHPWSLRWLEAAQGLMRPRCGLRQRLLLMAAILEATPEHAAWFLQPPPTRMRLFAGLAWRACASAAKILGGMALLPFVPRADERGR